MKTVTRLCLCAMLMFSFIAVSGCDAKKDAAPAPTTGADSADADSDKADDAEAK